MLTGESKRLFEVWRLEGQQSDRFMAKLKEWEAKNDQTVDYENMGPVEKQCKFIMSILLHHFNLKLLGHLKYNIFL